MGAAAKLFVEFTADVKGLVSGMKGAEGAAKTLGSTFKNVFAGTLAADIAGRAITGLGAAIMDTGKRALTLASEMEQAKIGFTTMLGSAEKADAFLRDLAKFAAETPFELRGLRDSSKRLMAFGFEGKAIIPIMTAVGNAVAGVGGGKDALDGITLALGQISAKGKVSAEEMNQLAERGIPAWKMLSDAIGVSIPQAMKMAEKGAIDSNTAIVALVNGMNKRFPDMMAKQSKTFGGAMSNLADVTDMALTKIGLKFIEAFNVVPIIQTVSAAIGGLTASLEKGGLSGAIDAAGQAFVAMGASAKVAVLSVAAAVTGVLTPAFLKFSAAAVRAIAAATIAFGPAIVAAASLAAAAYVIIRNWALIQDAIWYAMDNSARAVEGLRNKVVEKFNDVRGIVRDAMMYVGLLFRETFGDKIADMLGAGLAKAGSYLSGWTSEASSGLSGLSAAAGDSMRSMARSALEGAKDMGSVITDAARYAMDDVKSQFTLGMAKASEAVSKGFKAATHESLGLKKQLNNTANAAKKAAAEKKALAERTRQAAQENKNFFHELIRNVREYNRQREAIEKVNRALAEVDAKQKELGDVFDGNAEKAKVYEKSIANLERVFGAQSRQVLIAKAAIETYTFFSEQFTQAQAKIAQAVVDADHAIAAQALAARLLGEEFDESKVKVDEYTRVLKMAIDSGMKPGVKVVDDLANKIKKSKEEMEKKRDMAAEVTAELRNLSSGASSLLGGIGSLADAFGIKGVAAFIEYAQAGIKAGQALLDIAAAIPLLGKAFTALSALVAANPILAAILAVVGIVAVAGAAIYNWYQTTQAEAAKTAEEMKKVNDEAEKAADIARANDEVSRLYAERMVANNQRIAESFKATQDIIGNLKKTTESAIKTATLEFMAGIDGWAKSLEMKLKQAMFDGLMNKIVMEKVMGKLEKDFDAIATAVFQGNNTLATQLTANLSKTVSGMVGPVAEAGKMLLKGLGLAEGEAARVLDSALGKAQGAATKVDQGSRGAIESYLRAQMDALTRFRNMGIGPGTYQYEVTRDQAEAAARQLREMATGGLVTGPTAALIGEGRYPEAVLPLNDSVYRQIAEGINNQRGGGGTQVIVQYYGNGKWTREDAQGLGRLLVSELRTMGVRA